jgi:hypothetical protein
MKNKKSYMNDSNILNEGIFDIISNFINRKKNKKNKITSSDIKKIDKKTKLVSKLNNNISDMNKRQSKINAEFEKEFGVKIKSKPYKLSDFLK